MLSRYVGAGVIRSAALPFTLYIRAEPNKSSLLFRLRNVCRLPGRGYTFATWLRINELDPVPDAELSGGRSLYTLLWRSQTGDGVTKGVSAALKGALKGSTESLKN